MPLTTLLANTHPRCGEVDMGSHLFQNHIFDDQQSYAGKGALWKAWSVLEDSGHKGVLVDFRSRHHRGWTVSTPSAFQNDSSNCFLSLSADLLFVCVTAGHTHERSQLSVPTTLDSRLTVAGQPRMNVPGSKLLCTIRKICALARNCESCRALPARAWNRCIAACEPPRHMSDNGTRTMDYMSFNQQGMRPWCGLCVVNNRGAEVLRLPPITGLSICLRCSLTPDSMLRRRNQHQFKLQSTAIVAQGCVHIGAYSVRIGWSCVRTIGLLYTGQRSSAPLRQSAPVPRRQDLIRTTCLQQKPEAVAKSRQHWDQPYVPATACTTFADDVLVSGNRKLGQLFVAI